MVESIYTDINTTQNKNQEWFSERLLEADEQFSVWKDHGEFKKAQRYQTCDNWLKKKSSSIRATTKWFSGKLLAIKIRKIKAKMNKQVYLGLYFRCEQDSHV